MTKRMLIDAAHPEETRVVIVDGTRIEEFDFESQSRKQLRGNIYLAKVTRVEPSLQAAFVEYGGGRHGFLAFNEIHPDYYHIPLADKEALLREEAEEEEQFHASNGNGNGKASRARSDDAEGDDDEVVAVDDDDDVMEEELERRRRRLMRRYKIQEVIKRRQIMLVQVVKEERGNKGAALTTYLSLAGRYCVLMPNTARGGGISRKIVSATDRKRLKSVVQSLDTPQGMGLIVRTAGAKRTKAEIKRDYEYLLRLWENIREVTLNSIAPALIYEEEDLVKRAIRDMYDKDLSGIEVEGEQGFRDAKEFMRMLMPSQAKKITAYREPTPLFIKARVEDHLSQIYNPVVPLRSGGYLVINQTEALVAIDVNSGKSTRERNIEATALKTNMEAAEEAARQLRLRDLAGLIVIDFIDMDESKNNRAVEKKLKDALKDDRARIQMGRISSFGLMELSRQRRRTGVLEGTTHVCPHCQGVGRVRATESSALSSLRAVEMEAVRGGPGTVTVKVSRDVGLYILNEKRAYLLRLQAAQGLHVTIQIDDMLSHAEHEIMRTSTLTAEESRALVAAATSALSSVPAFDPVDDDLDLDVDEDEDEAEDDEEIVAEAEEAEDTDDDVTSRAPYEHREREDGAGRGRRRRRRGGRRDEPAEMQVASPRAADDEGDADSDDGDELDSNGRRRRRRGRRGGRRMREEARPNDVYAWSRVRVPHVDGVYGWFDPSSPPPAPEPRPAPAIQAAPEPAAAAAPQPPAAPQPDGEETYMWVELPEAAEPAPKAGRSRSRRKPAPQAEPAPVEAAAEAAPEPVEAAPAAEVQSEPEAPAKARRTRKPRVAAEAEPEAAATPEVPAEAAPKPRRSRAAAAAPPAEATPTDSPAVFAEAVGAQTVAGEVTPLPPAPEPERVPEPVAAAPDPAEIAAPPAQPKRGWWRR